MSKRKSKKAICLFSGGLDSTTVLYYAVARGFAPYALTFDYGQRHRKEIQVARRFAKTLDIPHEIVKINMPWGGSALTDKRIAVPKPGRISKKIPVTYVPARNIIFLSFAAAWAEVVGAETIFIGANQLDYSGYPDCRGPFLRAFEKAVAVGTKAGTKKASPKIKAPLLNKSKSEIVRLANRLGVPIEKTWSCYQGGKKPCGKCDSCLLRDRGIRDAGN